MNRSLLCAALLALSCLPVAGRCAAPNSYTYHYTAQGRPDFSSYRVGVATYQELTAALGQPIQGFTRTNTRGQVASTVFDIPLEGQRLPTVQAAPASAARNVVSSVAHSMFSSLLGRVEARVPNAVGSAVGNAVDNQVTPAASPVFAWYWQCLVTFTDGTFHNAQCNQQSVDTNALPMG